MANTNPDNFKVAPEESQTDTPQHRNDYSPENTIEQSIFNTKISCDVCSKSFPNRSKMLWHRQIHDHDRKLFYCSYPDCSRFYTSKQANEMHYKQTHLDEGLMCPVCDKKFAIRQTLEVHLRYHNKSYPFVCEICKKKFAQKGHLTTHMQIKHNNSRYVCSESGCGRIFKNSVSLKNHRFLHTGMPFSCAFCHKGYPQKGKLKVHISFKHNLELSLNELESMRKFREKRTRHSFVRIDNEETDEPSKSPTDKEESTACEYLVEDICVD